VYWNWCWRKKTRTSRTFHILSVFQNQFHKRCATYRIKLWNILNTHKAYFKRNKLDNFQEFVIHPFCNQSWWKNKMSKIFMQFLPIKVFYVPGRQIYYIKYAMPWPLSRPLSQNPSRFHPEKISSNYFIWHSWWKPRARWNVSHKTCDCWNS